jgi:hypothetical protein
MQISAANNSTPPLATTPKAPAPAASGPAAPVPDEVALRKVATLLTMLENNPEIRPDVVARGRALAADASYPPPDIINKLANLIASKVR